MLYSFRAVDDAPVNIGEDEEDHTAKHGGDENFIKEIDVIHNGVMFGAGLVVAHPCGGEVGGGIRVTALAFDEQVFAQGHARFGIVHFANVVYAVAVGADWFVGGLAGELFFKELDGGTMEIRHVGIDNVCGDPILVHDGRVGMAFGAQGGRTVMERDSGWVLNVMYAVTINTGGDVGIAFLRQRIAMYTGFVCVINFGVALGAGFGDFQARGGCEFATGSTRETGLGVRVMTVHADGGVFVALVKCALVDAIVHICILFLMTFLAGFEKAQGKVTRVFNFYIGMGIVADIGMTVDTGDSLFAVNGQPKLGWVDGDGQGFVAQGLIDPFLLMAGQTKVVGGFILLIGGRRLGGRSEKGQGEG